MLCRLAERRLEGGLDQYQQGDGQLDQGMSGREVACPNASAREVCSDAQPAGRFRRSR